MFTENKMYCICCGLPVPYVHSSTNLITLYFTNAVKLTDMITWLDKPKEKTQIGLFSDLN